MSACELLAMVNFTLAGRASGDGSGRLRTLFRLKTPGGVLRRSLLKTLLGRLKTRKRLKTRRSRLETGRLETLSQVIVYGFPGFSSTFYRRVDFQSMHSLRRAGVWPPLLGLRFFLRLRESNRRAGRLIASAGAAGQHVAETGQPSFELQRPPRIGSCSVYLRRFIKPPTVQQ